MKQPNTFNPVSLAGFFLVDVSYSRRARDVYKDCQLVEIHGDHGFIRSGFWRSLFLPNHANR